MAPLYTRAEDLGIITVENRHRTRMEVGKGIPLTAVETIRGHTTHDRWGMMGADSLSVLMPERR
jgi:hypothetical protein